jgi:hypothetical protein
MASVYEQVYQRSMREPERFWAAARSVKSGDHSPESRSLRKN